MNHDDIVLLSDIKTVEYSESVLKLIVLVVV